jgi:hypothetical protein
VEVVGGKAMLALQDSKNVDLNCILKNDGTFTGCNGDSRGYPFTENRSVCSCNGIAGDLDGKEYIGDGSPIAQSFWIDDLTIATAKP